MPDQVHWRVIQQIESHCILLICPHITRAFDLIRLILRYLLMIVCGIVARLCLASRWRVRCIYFCISSVLRSFSHSIGLLENFATHHICQLRIIWSDSDEVDLSDCFEYNIYKYGNDTWSVLLPNRDDQHGCKWTLFIANDYRFSVGYLIDSKWCHRLLRCVSIIDLAYHRFFLLSNKYNIIPSWMIHTFNGLVGERDVWIYVEK